MINHLSKGLIAFDLIDLDNYLNNYLNTERFKDFEYRLKILTYNVGDLNKRLVYEQFYGYSSIDLKTCFSDILMTILLLCKIKGFQLSDILNIGISRYDEKVYKTKEDK